MSVASVFAGLAPWPAPAKLNLFLHVVARGSDGYHQLQTAFQLIDLCDRIWIAPRDDGQIRRHAGPAGVAEADDLVVRAARRLRELAGRPALGVDLAVEKQIPMGGGLGGGSSDAATVLIALNIMWGVDVPAAALRRLALELGADVPVFLEGRTAWGEGVGESLTPFERPEHWFAVISPEVSVGTAEIFQAPELTRNSPIITIRGFIETGGRNDCEPVVTARYPAVRRALDWLNARGNARLTGTGACVFAEFAHREAAVAALADLPSAWRGFVARGLARSPLHERAAGEVASRRG